jgi:hypothetical protein
MSAMMIIVIALRPAEGFDADCAPSFTWMAEIAAETEEAVVPWAGGRSAVLGSPFSGDSVAPFCECIILLIVIGIN